jgi:hypothetical protein
LRIRYWWPWQNKTENMNNAHAIHVPEPARQLILLALAELSLTRPGWLNHCEEVALLMDDKMPDGKAARFERYRLMRSDVVAEVLARGPFPDIVLDPAYPVQDHA